MVKKYVEEHFGEPLTLEELSQVVDLSPTYLSTIFKKDTGMTFLEYLSKVRMDMAKKLLKETNDTVLISAGRSVTAMCGISRRPLQNMRA